MNIWSSIQKVIKEDSLGVLGRGLSRRFLTFYSFLCVLSLRSTHTAWFLEIDVARSILLCRAIFQAGINLFWICKNLKSSIFNGLHVFHVGLCHLGVFMVFLETLTDKNVKNRPKKSLIFKNCNFFTLFFSWAKPKVLFFQNMVLDNAKKWDFRRI